MLYSFESYTAPSWAAVLSNPPTEKIKLAHGAPTPIHPWRPCGYESNQMFIKRDDLTSFDQSGNKVRKLEFLMAQALRGGYDSIITIGGIQSNHARSTACCARQLGLDPHLILRTSKDPTEDPSHTGNLLLDRLVGAKIYQVSTGTYARIGSVNLCDQLKRQLQKEGKNPYVIPVGGSNVLGAWGYLEAINEIYNQINSNNESFPAKFDHIVFACGSGGTATGLALGARLASLGSKIHAVGVCDSPDYFYKHIEEVSVLLGVDFSEIGYPRDWCTVYRGQGLGYAKSTEEEINFIQRVSMTTGIITDPVYSGKALYYFSQPTNRVEAGIQDGESILFVHTGGVLGMYDKIDQLNCAEGTVTKMSVALEE